MLLLWCAVAAVGAWNLHLIDRAVIMAELEASVAANRQVLDADDDQIRQLEQQIAALARPVESPAFGLLYLEQDLAMVARTAGMADFRMSSGAASADAATVDVSFSGGMVGAARWLELIKAQMPYLVVKSFQASASADSPSAVFTVTLMFRYRVAPSQV